MVPKELHSIRQWSHSFNTTELKRPAHHDYIPNGALSYTEAKAVASKQGYLTGFYVTRSDNYILGDIDKITNINDPWEEIPIEITMLLRVSPTYVEISPSGKGLRFVYKLKDDKAITTGSYYLLRKDHQGEFDPKHYQINFDKPWMTITGNKTSWSTDTINEIELSELEQAFAIRYAKKKQQDLTPVDTTNLPGLTAIISALKNIPVDQNPRIIRAYEKTFEEGYAHYTFWMKVMMAVHNYASLSGNMVECLQAFNQWSAKDADNYNGEDDVTKHWDSLSNTEDSVTYRSLFKLANTSVIRWPRPKKRTTQEVERNTPLKPLLTEYANFKAMISFYNIQLYRSKLDPNTLYMTADMDIIETYCMVYQVKEWLGLYGPYTKDTLTPALYVLAQDIGFVGMSHGQMNQFIKTYLAETTQMINPIRLFFDMPFRKLPEKYQENADKYNVSTIDYLYEALDIDYQTGETDKEDDLYKSYYKIWLLGLVRNMYYSHTQHQNNCVLLLTGVEQVRKTSHFRYLLPTFLREHIAFTTHGFATESSMRDVTKLASSSLVLVWDEIEQYLNSETESNFKKIIDGIPQKIIDKYETLPVTIVPRCLYGATSNKREFKLGDDGSRRLFHIPVKWVDTDHMNTVCWHSLINGLKKEAEFSMRAGDVPWLLTQDQLDYQAQLHRNIRSKTTLDYALEELFKFEESRPLHEGGVLPGAKSIQSDKTGTFKTTKEISDTLIRFGFGQIGIKRPALVKTLERLCGEYTQTRKYGVMLRSPKCTVHRGLATQHMHKKWVMAPMRMSIEDVYTKEFEEVI